MIDRMAEDTHPHLELELGGLHEPVLDPVDGFWHRSALVRAWWITRPYRTDYPLELAARIFRETDRLARERGATAIFLAPNQNYGSPRGDRYLLDELFTRQGLTVIDADFGYHPLQDDVQPRRSVDAPPRGPGHRLAPRRARPPVSGLTRRSG
jgi:hypothetical protein